MRLTVLLAFRAAASLAAFVAPAALRAQDATPPTPPADSETAWEFGLSGALYVLPDEEDFVQPTFRADHGVL
ncbi:MAG: hypothetical protein ACHP85_08705, partial [Burkholderiales bacterium]